MVFSEHASSEIMKLNLDERDILEALEEGVESRKRKEGVCELELAKGKRIRKAVVAESWQYHSKQIVFVVVHVGEYAER